METRRLATDTGGIADAAALLRRGELVAFPTETVYGLGGDARSDIAVARIFDAKGRPRFNPLIVHVPELRALGEIAELVDAAKPLTTLWPGPLTLVLPIKPEAGLSPLVTAELPTVAVRIPAHPVAQRLLRAFGGPVAAPSANPSGRVSPTTAGHVMDGLSGRIAAVLDGGPCDVGLESTIVGFAGGRASILRQGGIPQETVEQLLGYRLSEQENHERPTAPGQLLSHYATEAAIRLGATAVGPGELWIGFGPGDSAAPFNLSRAGDLVEAAANLFRILREADAEARGRAIYISPIPETGLGRAINDRLRRAAAPRQA